MAHEKKKKKDFEKTYYRAHFWSRRLRKKKNQLTRRKGQGSKKNVQRAYAKRQKRTNLTWRVQ